MSVYYKWFRNFFGSSLLEIRGEKEKLINVLSEKGIYFWGTEIKEDGSMNINGSVFSAGKIIEEGEKLGCTVSVLKRKGLPFLAEKYKKRYAIMVGVIIAWAFLFLSSLVVWDVQISERSGEDPQKICEYLEKCGLETGTFLPRLNVRAVENQFMIEHSEYSFIAVNVCGTVARVELRRAVKAGDPENLAIPSNVVAQKSGTVISVEAYGGSPAVKSGDVVEEGDLLISSFMEGSFGVQRSVHAYGKVKAAVSYEFETEIPFEYEISSLTGKEETKKNFKILGFNVPFFSDEKTSFEKCVAISEKKRLEIFDIKLPLEVERVEYLEQAKEIIILTENEAEKKALEEFERWKSREIKGEIISEVWDVTFDENGKACKLKASLIVEEDIAKTVLLE